MAAQIIRNTHPKVSSCESIVAYTFTNKLLILQALNNASPPIALRYNNTTHHIPNNSALAVLGDTRMDAILCRWWWDRGAPRIKGHWTQIRHDKCGNAALAMLGRGLGLNACVIANPGSLVVSDKMVATAVEAVLGAVYLDGGEEEMERVMRGLGFDQHQYL
jgi:ribonuclease-3